MTYLQLFIAFFIPGVLGYGGGPASIPLVENEVIDRFGWMTVKEFGEVLAIANSLPGPIATKMAGYIGYEVAGVFGSLVSIFATVAPSLILMVVLGGLLYKYKTSPKVQRLALFVQPVIAILLGVLTWNFLSTSAAGIGLFQTVVMVGVSYLLVERMKVHPVFVIGGALVYGGMFL